MRLLVLHFPLVFCVDQYSLSLIILKQTFDFFVLQDNLTTNFLKFKKNRGSLENSSCFTTSSPKCIKTGSLVKAKSKIRQIKVEQSHPDQKTYAQLNADQDINVSTPTTIHQCSC